MAKLTDTQRLDFLAKHGWITVARKDGGDAYLALGEDHLIALPLRSLIDIAHKQDQERVVARLEANIATKPASKRRQKVDIKSAKRRVKK